MRALALWLSLVTGLTAATTAQDLPREPGADTLMALDLARGELVALSLPRRATGPLQVDVRLAGSPATLALRPHSVRANDFRLYTRGLDGALVPQTPAAPSTVRGSVVGDAGSVVTGRLRDGRLTATIRLASGAVWALQPASHGDGPSPGLGGAGSGARGATSPTPIEHVVYDAADSVAPEGACAVSFPDGVVSSFAPPTATGSSGDLLCEIACEADVEYFEANGSSILDTHADIESVINGCEAIYDASVGVRYEITTIVIQTVEPDPYDTADPEGLLIQFRQEWNAEHDLIVRDVAHLFTGRDLIGGTIGIAYVDVICSQGWGYGLSQSRYTGNFAARVALTAHELGHNWSANHCNGGGDCAIMCSSLGGCNGITSFGSLSLAAITSARDAAACLAEVEEPGEGGGPFVSAITPDFGSAEGGAQVVITGGNFVDDPATSVRFDGVDVQVLSITEPDAIVIAVPAGLAGHAVAVTVSGPTGADTLASGFSYEWALVPGDRVRSGLGPGDVDRAYVRATAGSRLSAKLRRVGGADNALVPGLRIMGPGDVLLADVAPTGTKTTATKVKQVPLDETGVYRIEMYGVGGTTGEYLLATSMKRPGKIVVPFALGPADGPLSTSFGALPGTLLKSLTVRAQKAKGPFASIEGLPSNLLPLLTGLLDPEGAELTGEAELLINKAGTAVTVKGIALDAFGTYDVGVAADAATVGHGRVILRLKHPGAKKTTHVVDPIFDQP